MKISQRQPSKRFVRVGFVLLAVVMLLFWAAWSFAVQDEETIHIFPSEVSSENWNNPDGALETSAFWWRFAY